MGKQIGRRTFIEVVGATAGSVVLAEPYFAGEAHAAAPNVYSGYSAKMSSGTHANETWVQAALDACVKALVAKTTVGAAWDAVFSGITPSKKVAVKINCLVPAVSPQFATLKALVKGLTQMCGGSFPAKNILLFDNTYPGTNGAGRMANVYGATNLNALGITYADPSPMYANTSFSVSGQIYHPATYLAQANYGISLAPLKRHSQFGGGLTGVIKNMMGACSTQTNSYTGGPTFHVSAPYKPFVEMFQKYMRAHLNLYLVDMVFAAKSQSATGWSKAVNRITLGTDPCAVDAYAASVLKSLGMATTDAVPRALAAAGIGTANFQLKEPTVTVDDPSAPSRDAVDTTIRDRRAGKASDGDVKAVIKKYRGK